MLARYNEIIPDGANRLIGLVERQQNHRFGLENCVVRSDAHRSTAGLVCGLVIALAFLAAAVAMVLSGHDTAGTIIGSIDLVALVGTFVYGSRTRRQERLEKAMVMTGRDANSPSSRN
jgi:uncharacterized membrane protein